MAERTSLLAVSGLGAGYGRTRIVSEVDLVVEPGSWFGLLGANGSGKSTLLRAITGQIQLQDGQVLVAGIDMAKAPERAKRLIGYAVDGADTLRASSKSDWLASTSLARRSSAPPKSRNSRIPRRSAHRATPIHEAADDR